MVPWLSALHAEYGDVVRIKPNELSFISGSAWSEIYAARPQLPKPVEGSIVAVNGTRPIATIVHTPDHTRQRRILGHAFSDRALKQQEYILQQYADMLIQQLREVAETRRAVNLCDWYNFITFDIISDLCFGESFNNLETGKHHNWVAITFRSLKFLQVLTVLTLFPPLDKIVATLMPGFVKRQAERHFRYSADQIDKRLASKADRPDIMKFLLENNHAKGMSRAEIDATVQLLVFAGSETSATNLTSATWFSLREPAIWDRLKGEIRSAFSSVDEIDVASVSKLPYVHAVLSEALRRHPPAPVAMPRVVDRPDVVVSGRSIPLNVGPLPCRLGADNRLSWEFRRNPHITLHATSRILMNSAQSGGFRKEKRNSRTTNNVCLSRFLSDHETALARRLRGPK